MPEIAVMPDWLLDAALTTTGRTSRDEWDGETLFELAEDGGVSEGDRNGYLFRFSCSALCRPGVTGDDLADLAHAENQRVCVPLLDGREVEAIARSAARYESSTSPPAIEDRFTTWSSRRRRKTAAPLFPRAAQTAGRSGVAGRSAATPATRSETVASPIRNRYAATPPVDGVPSAGEEPS